MPSLMIDSYSKYHTHLFWRCVLGMAGGMALLVPMFLLQAAALPPPEDTPEEILRTEIILEARSPLDGEPLTASEYVELQQDLAEPEHPPTIASETQHLIFLIRIRKVINMVSPVPLL